MANYPSKTSIPTAIDSSCVLNLNSDHKTTANFMELGVAKLLPVVPGQSYDISHHTFTRLEPMPVPTFGTAYLHSRWFFVPCRTIMPAFNDFITDTPHVSTNSNVANAIPNVHTVTNNILRSFLLSLCDDVTGDVDDSGTQVVSDIVTIELNGGAKYYNFTQKGALCNKILQQLGYAINYNYRGTAASTNKFSALPLLALAKIYMDWYYPSVYATDYEASKVVALFNKDYSNGYSMTQSDLDSIFNIICYVCYESDYLVSSWDNPVAPTTGTHSSISILDPTSNNLNTVSTSADNGTPTVALNQNGLTQFSDDALHALTDYLKRHQISSARVLDRYLARFGKVLDSAVLDRCVYLGSNTNTIEFGNVTSTSDTEGAELGSYAGVGVGELDTNVNFNSDEYGYLLCISTIVPRTSYYQGCDRLTLHLSKLDFWTPEFDNLGVQALATREVFVPMDSREQYGTNQDPTSTTDIDYDKLVFGFVPRYAEYKRGRDQMTGDYRLATRNATRGAWTLDRDLKPYFAGPGIRSGKHSIDFMMGVDSNQYDRIFYYGREHGDTFNVLHIFYIKSSFPGKALYDTYEFENEGTAKKVSIDVNGVKAN